MSPQDPFSEGPTPLASPPTPETEEASGYSSCWSMFVSTVIAAASPCHRVTRAWRLTAASTLMEDCVEESIIGGV